MQADIHVHIGQESEHTLLPNTRWQACQVQVIGGATGPPFCLSIPRDQTGWYRRKSWEYGVMAESSLLVYLAVYGIIHTTLVYAGKWSLKQACMF